MLREYWGDGWGSNPRPPESQACQSRRKHMIYLNKTQCNDIVYSVAQRINTLLQLIDGDKSVTAPGAHS
jgi:hypothetical protein